MDMDISMGKQILAESTVEELAEVTKSWWKFQKLAEFIKRQQNLAEVLAKVSIS